MLTDNPWSGGAGYTPIQVAEMTLDQIWSRLCDIKILKNPVGDRTERVKPLNAASKSKSKDGTMQGLSLTGETLKLRSSGQSKAKMLREGTYEGYVINDETGEKEYITPKRRRRRRRK